MQSFRLITGNPIFRLPFRRISRTFLTSPHGSATIAPGIITPRHSMQPFRLITGNPLFRLPFRRISRTVLTSPHGSATIAPGIITPRHLLSDNCSHTFVRFLVFSVLTDLTFKSYDKYINAAWLFSRKFKKLFSLPNTRCV